MNNTTVPPITKTWAYLYKPISGLEYHLIKLSGWNKFPPHLLTQPIFYSASSEAYAMQAARELLEKDKKNGEMSFVAKVKISKSFLSMYNPKMVGGTPYKEYWILYGHMDMLNANIVGDIEIVHTIRRALA